MLSYFHVRDHHLNTTCEVLHFSSTILMANGRELHVHLYSAFPLTHHWSKLMRGGEGGSMMIYIRMASL